jgi:hypothetical protein
MRFWSRRAAWELLRRLMMAYHNDSRVDKLRVFLPAWLIGALKIIFVMVLVI